MSTPDTHAVEMSAVSGAADPTLAPPAPPATAVTASDADSTGNNDDMDKSEEADGYQSEGSAPMGSRATGYRGIPRMFTGGSLRAGIPRTGTNNTLQSEILLGTSEIQVKSIIDWELGKREGSTDVLVSFVADQIGSVVNFFRIIFMTNPVDIVIISLLSSASALFFYTYKQHKLAYDLNWTLLSIALVFPLTMTMTESFRRREIALQQLQILKSNLLSLFIAHFDWDWYTIPSRSPAGPVRSGRYDADSIEGGRLSPTHCHELKSLLFRYIDVMFTVLTSPRISKAKHFYTNNGVDEREYIQTIQGQLDDCCVHFYHDISKMGERLKAAGMNPGEKSRVSNFEHNFYQAYLIMRSIKDYRTPQGLRAFARMYILILPIMFGPYYALVASSTNLGFAIVLTIVTSAAMQGLFNLRHKLEDPFRSPQQEGINQDIPDGSTIIIGDTIDLRYEFQNLKSDIQIVLDNKRTTHVDDFQTVDVDGRQRVVSMDTVAPLFARHRSMSQITMY